MRFPIKNIKLNPNTIATLNPTYRKEFVEDLPGKVKNGIRGVDLALINEAITAIAGGHTTINGKEPNTRSERNIVIASYFNTVRTSSNTFFDAVSNIENNYIVTFKHNEKPYTIKFPECLAEN